MKYNEPSLKSFRVSDTIVNQLIKAGCNLSFSKSILARAAFNLGCSELSKFKTKRAQCAASHQIDVRDGVGSVSSFRLTKKQEGRASNLKCIDVIGYSATCRLCLLLGALELNYRKNELSKKDYINYVLINSFDEA